jgi:phosphoribosylamine-glycine ligase
MIRVVAIDEETGERLELEGSRVVVLVGDGDSMTLAQVKANDAAVAMMLSDAMDQVVEDECPLDASPAPRHATLH